MTTALNLLAVGPARGGVRDAFAALIDAIEAGGDRTLIEFTGSHRPAAWDAARLAWRRRGQLRSADAVHVEFGSNDLSAFWFAFIAVHVRRDVVVVVHDVPKVALHPASGLVPVTSRVGSVVGYRILAPLADGRSIRRLLRRAGRVVVLSEEARRTMAGRGVKSSTIPHGAGSPSIGAPPPSRGAYVLFAGHINPSKGVDVLLDAWGRAAGAGDRLVIAGPTEGESAAYAEQLRARAAAFANVTWLGPVEGEDAFQKLFAEASIVVLPYTYSSPASGILVRAMVEGRCIIATPVPAVVDVTRDCPDALIVVPKGDSGALAAALESALGDGDLRDAYGRRAAVAARRFSWEASAQAFRTLYER